MAHSSEALIVSINYPNKTRKPFQGKETAKASRFSLLCALPGGSRIFFGRLVSGLEPFRFLRRPDCEGKLPSLSAGKHPQFFYCFICEEYKPSKTILSDWNRFHHFQIFLLLWQTLGQISIIENHFVVTRLAFRCRERALLTMVPLSVSTDSITMVECVLASRRVWRRFSKQTDRTIFGIPRIRRRYCEGCMPFPAAIGLRRCQRGKPSPRKCDSNYVNFIIYNC